MDRHPLQLGDIAESDRFAQKAQDISTTGSAEGTVLVVGRFAFPFSETGGLRRCYVAGWEVSVGEGHEVLREGALVGLFETREGKGAGLEFARRWV